MRSTRFQIFFGGWGSLSSTLPVFRSWSDPRPHTGQRRATADRSPPAALSAQGAWDRARNFARRGVKFNERGVLKAVGCLPASGDPGVAEYRAYVVGHDGHFLRFEALICADDAEAIEKAKRLRHSRCRALEWGTLGSPTERRDEVSRLDGLF
jgi:hypothetical protein